MRLDELKTLTHRSVWALLYKSGLGEVKIDILSAKFKGGSGSQEIRKVGVFAGLIPDIAKDFKSDKSIKPRRSSVKKDNLVGALGGASDDDYMYDLFRDCASLRRSEREKVELVKTWKPNFVQSFMEFKESMDVQRKVANPRDSDKNISNRQTKREDLVKTLGILQSGTPRPNPSSFNLAGLNVSEPEGKNHTKIIFDINIGNHIGRSASNNVGLFPNILKTSSLKLGAKPNGENFTETDLDVRPETGAGLAFKKLLKSDIRKKLLMESLDLR